MTALYNYKYIKLTVYSSNSNRYSLFHHLTILLFLRAKGKKKVTVVKKSSCRWWWLWWWLSICTIQSSSKHPWESHAHDAYWGSRFVEPKYMYQEMEVENRRPQGCSPNFSVKQSAPNCSVKQSVVEYQLLCYFKHADTIYYLVYIDAIVH